MPAETNRILRQPDVRARIGLSKSTIYELIRKKELKAPIKLGERSVGWLESDINEFLAKRIKISRACGE